MSEVCSELLYDVYTELDLLSNGSHLGSRCFTKSYLCYSPMVYVRSARVDLGSC
jgi:hypothetical protein